MKRFTLILTLSLLTIFAGYSQVTRYWVGGGTAYGNNQNKWSLTSGGSPIGGSNPIQWQVNDIAIFDANSGSNIVVIINAIGTIGKLYIYGNQTVTVKGDGIDDRTLDLDTEGSETFYLGGGSTFIIVGASNGMYLRINMNSYTTAKIYGYLMVTDDINGYGEFSKSSSASITFYDGSTYEHNSKESGSDIPDATWNTGSTCKITGITGDLPGNYNQSFNHLTWDCGSQSKDLDFNGQITTINGNFTVANTNNYILGLSGSTAVTTTIKGNYIQSGGKFAMARYAPDNTLNIDGNFTLTGGYFYMSISDGANSIVNLKGNMSLSSGAQLRTSDGTSAYTNFNFTGTGNQSFTNSGAILYYKTHFTVVSPAVLDLGGSVLGHHQYSTGDFTLQSGAGIKTSHTSGMTATGNASGCIQLMGTRNYSSGGHYTFYGSGAQATGNGLPTSPTGKITIGSAANTTNLSFSNSTTIGGSLIIVKGSVATSNISYASGGVLEYGGNALQTMGNNEWPSSTVPNLKITNSSGVLMNAGKTVTNNLNLFAGTLSIGNNNTLTFHNSSITVNSGSLTGGSLSNIIFSGSGSTTLPGVINGLKDLTVNRSGATINIGGVVNVTGTLTMTAGSCTLGVGNITYGPSAILLYNGSATQTTGSAEFPTSNQPSQIKFQNPTLVNLHENRSFSGTISLESGNFNIGNHQFTLNGYFNQTGGSMESGLTGHLNFTENVNPTILPSGSTIATVTINRSGGINLAGNATINSNLILENGYLVIGANLLTLNGLITQNSGTMTGGDESSVFFGGSGASTTLPAITLSNLTVNRSNGISLGGDVTVNDQLYTQAGTLNIGSNALYINGIMKTQDGSLADASSTLQINDSEAKISTDLPAANLGYLLIYRTDGVTMKGNVTVNNELSIFAGSLNIGQNNTLSLFGTLVENTGTLESGSESSLTIGGGGELIDLNLTNLFNLSLFRISGISLNKSLTIWGTFSLSSAEINLNENMILYGPNGSLRYSGLTTQTTTAKEWPASNSPRNISIQNFSGVALHDDRTISGSLNLESGIFEIGTNTLTLTGNINKTMGTMAGSLNSTIVAGNSMMIMSLFLPEITLKDLMVDRMSGLHLSGNLDLYGTLSLSSGEFQINNHTLTLRKPISGNLDNFKSSAVSNLIIDGTESGLNIGATENVRITNLNSLTIANQHVNGISLNGALNLDGQLTINAGSKFNLNPESQLTIRGNMMLAEPECLILKSNAVFTASLILYGEQTCSGSVRVERYIKGYTSNTDGWHLFGCPVSNFLIDESSFHPGNEDDLFIYSEPDNLWMNYKVPGNFTHFEAGKGYLVASHTNDNKWVSGMINNQELSFSGFSITDGRGWHLLGNPFPSPLRWNDGLWHIEGINHLAKLWQESIHNYSDLDPNELVPAHNGFFIRVNSEINKLTIPLMSREHENLSWQKSIEMPTLILKAQSIENNTATICRVRFYDDASAGFDNFYDAHYLAGFPQPPEFYSKTTCGEMLSTNTLPFSEETTVQLHFAKGLSGAYHIDAGEISSFPVGVKIVLKDNLLNIPIDLAIQSSYYFTSNPEDHPDRFTLHFSNHTGVEEFHSTSEPTFIFSDGKIQILNLDTNSNIPAMVEIFDLTGRLILKTPAPMDGKITCTGLVKGIYLIKLSFFNTDKCLSSKISVL